jgi:hypothetical protein
MRYALISHGTDRINNYANFGALAAFSYPRTQILRIPADALARRGSDQQAMLRTYHDIRTKQQTKSSGSSSSTSIQIHPYAGFRCTQDERQFYIRDAIVHLLYICLGADSSLHITDKVQKNLKFGLNVLQYRYGIVMIKTNDTLDKQHYLIDKKWSLWIYNALHDGVSSFQKSKGI